MKSLSGFLRTSSWRWLSIPDRSLDLKGMPKSMMSIPDWVFLRLLFFLAISSAFLFYLRHWVVFKNILIFFFIFVHVLIYNTWEFGYIGNLYYLAFPFLYCFGEWKYGFKSVLSSPLGLKSRERSLGMRIKLQIGKGTWNPNDPVYAYTRVRTQALTMRTHPGLFARMPPGRKTLADIFHYKTVVKGFQTFTKCVLSLRNIL